MSHHAMKKEILNKMQLKLPAISANESACRAMIAAFAAQINPNIEELADLKCAVSEAVTNAVVHAYRCLGGDLYITVTLYRHREIRIDIRDKGCGIPDVALARQPLYTTDTDGERSGMGFSVMETFCDRVLVTSKLGRGTRVTMYKKLIS